MLQVLTEDITPCWCRAKEPSNIGKDFAKRFNTKEYEAIQAATYREQFYY